MQAHSSIAVTSPEGLVQRHQDSLFSLLYTSEVSPQYYSVITPLMRVHVCCDLIGDIWFYIISILNRCYVAIRLQTGHCSISGHTHTPFTDTLILSLGPKLTCYLASKALREQLLLCSASSTLWLVCVSAAGVSSHGFGSPASSPLINLSHIHLITRLQESNSTTPPQVTALLWGDERERERCRRAFAHLELKTHAFHWGRGNSIALKSLYISKSVITAETKGLN